MGSGDSNSKALSVVYDTATADGGQLSSTNNNPKSLLTHLSQAKVYSYQIIADGNTLVNWTVQVTNVPTNIMTFGSRMFGTQAQRDDSLGSQDWSTVETGQLAKAGSKQGTIRVYQTNAHLFSRILFNWDATNTAGTTSNIWACVRVMGV